MTRKEIVSTVNDLLHKKYEELTIHDIELLRRYGVLNGFGGSGQSWLSRYLIGYIMRYFSIAIPDKHDFGYWIGGDEARRLECDEKFYQAILDDIINMYKMGKISKSREVWYIIIALLSYNAIRWQGDEYFNYHK